jgi:hypothetical protein
MQAFGALEIAFGSRTLRFRLREFALQPVHFCLQGAWIDLKQQVALPNDFAFLETYALQVARNTRADFDRMDSFEAAGELVTVPDLFADNFRYIHFDRSRGRGLRLSGGGAPGIQAGNCCQADEEHQPGQ